MPVRWKAAVVGLGQIGMGYDYAQPGSVLTHAQAFHVHGDFELLAGMDPREENRQRFTRKFGVPAFSDLSEMLAAVNPEVIAVCTPTDSHVAVCREALRASPKAIILEKPVCYSLAEAESLRAYCAERGVPVLVNYMRRFEPGALRLKDILRKGSLGKIQRGTVFYSKGLFNNASHFIDLLGHWFGEGELRCVTRGGRKFPQNDVEPDFILLYAGFPVSFQALKEEAYSVAELHLFGELGRVSYLDGGARIELLRTADDPSFPGYRILDPVADIIPTDLSRYQFYVADALSKHLKGEAPGLASSLESATITLKITEQVKQAAEKMGGEQ